MKLNISRHQQVVTVQLTETLVMSNADTTRLALTELTDQGNHFLIIDLSLVNFLDSSGLAVLIAIYKQVNRQQGQVVLLQPQNNVRALIELTRLHQIFDIYEDPQSAIHSLQAA
ncbi:STAS domain-containing protein [Amphritea sp. 1_MG-2023]|uniref:STAS domain-containing protein n=1 Tax=Amphritea sp. 1_MG-2023 TaxID=3062670 RepID=UPI0026E2AAA7|nr:STAS domain-containing protein [Amphritea sp. 1_MG-2023]MDO6563778.1 STAS domain-containing protein [Amphritea sp. 1_MG-2023]